MSTPAPSLPVPDASQGRVSVTGRNLPAFALVAVALISLPHEQRSAGPGDTLGDVLTVGGVAAVGAVASLVYGAVERDAARAARVRLAAWVVIRFFLAFELTRYGMAKLVGMKFYPRYYQFDSRVADLKPMHLAWSFFGHGYGYQAISGAMEVVGAVLLCFRRTTTLGACVLFAVMTNVVLVNVYYDVPVKLFSSTYLVMSLYLLGLEWRRFWAFFITDGPVVRRVYLAPPARARSKRLEVARAAAVVLVLVVPACSVVREASQHRIFTEEALVGAWSVDRRSGLDDVVLVGETSSPWDKVYFEKGDYGFIRVGTQRVRFDMKVDEPAGKVSLTMFGGRESPALEGTFVRHERALHIEGTRAGRPFFLDLTRDLPR